MADVKPVGTAVALVVSVLVLPASAEEYSLPGISCVEPDNRIVYAGGNARNPHATSDASFRCPVFRRAPDTSQVTSVFAEVDDQHSSESVECFVRSCGPQGDSCESTTPQLTGIGATGEATLSLGAVNGDTDGYAYVVCNVPDEASGESGVLSYRWVD